MKTLLPLALLVGLIGVVANAADSRPNIVVIYADDVGYGDLGCYGATKVRTPNLDRMAKEGLRFTDGHAASATCTPSRYALMTGQYPWRKKGTNILPGDASLILEPGTVTLPSILRDAGYQTGVVGKWHLGLGDSPIDWNAEIKPGPREIGFDYSFLIPATGDRVPCVYVENQRVVGLDPNDPIRVSYAESVGDEPTGKKNPELLKMKLTQGHDNTIVNGISRIGSMSGGKAARWVDEDMADVITKKATAFIESRREAPFFLFFATHDIHVPRAPHKRFVGTSDCGTRGDMLHQLDASVGEILATLERLKLSERTLVIFSSDNGPVLDDGYADGAVKDLNGHRPSGDLQGGKYSLYEGGTRVPFIAHWPARIKPGVSNALVCQMDFAASFAALVERKLPDDAAPDSVNVLPALLGESTQGREHLVEQGGGGLALRRGTWKYIPGKGDGPNAPAKKKGPDAAPRLFDLAHDLPEKTNLAEKEGDIVEEMAALLEQIRNRKPLRP